MLINQSGIHHRVFAGTLEVNPVPNGHVKVELQIMPKNVEIGIRCEESQILLYRM